jgi:antitoxin YefM
MTTLSYTEARDRLASIWDESVATREPITLQRRGHESMVLIPIGEWSGLVETAHLLRSPANARRLLAALNRLEANDGESLTPDALAAKAGLS